jgi:hypothetical protein
MPRLAKTRIVGTSAAIRLALPLAIPLAMAWTGTATSQSTVFNGQVQGGNVTASQQLDVVTNSSDTTAVTTATGNSFVGSVVTGSLDVTSSQTGSGNVGASTVINVASDAGPTTQSATAATGNSGSAVILGGGGLSGSFLQTSASATVDAESQLNAANAQTADAAFSVQDTGNGQVLGSTDSAIGASVSQSNASNVTANGGVVFGDVTDQGSFTAVGAGNTLTSVGQGASAQAIDVSQTNTGAVTQGAVFANFGQSEITDTSAVATGNSATVTNTEGGLAVTTSQDNESFVHGQSVETSFDWGGATVSAEAVGNSAVAANVGPSLALNNTQLNGAQGVESSASFQGDTGFDAAVSSSAIGNSVTGFACSACGGVMNVTNNQTNLGDAAASTQIGLTGSARSVSGAATAVGNSATFFVSSPH